MSLKVEWVTDDARWEALASEWDTLADAVRDPFLRHAWLTAWWHAFRPQGAMATCTIRDAEGTLLAALPAWSDGQVLHGMGDTEVWLGIRPLARDDAAREALLDAALGKGGHRLFLPDVPADDPATEAFVRGCAARRYAVRMEPYRRSPVIDTTGSFDDWRTLTKPRWRTKIEALERKMGRDHEMEMVVMAESVDVDAALSKGFEVEAKGWKGDTGTAISVAPGAEGFYRTVARSLAERGELRVSWIALDGTWVVFDVGFVAYDRFWGVKTGFDPAFRKLAPGFVLRLAQIRRCFELPIEAFELLGDADEWKMRFATGAHERRVLHAAPRLSKQALRWAARDALAPVVRAVRSRSPESAPARP